MLSSKIFRTATLAGVLALGGALVATAQQKPEPLTMGPARERGASITPAFEGWYQNEDGSYSVLIGYFNRNSKEALDIPIGPNNRIEPGEPDQGQPTHFEIGRQWGVFVVKVPKDYGKQKFTWTVVANGEVQSIPFTLNPGYPITPFEELGMGNKPPALAFTEGGPKVTGPPVGVAATLTGKAGHAGTSSMALRRDALTAAAEAVLAVERVAREGPADLVATVGRLAVAPGAPNVIPGRVEFTIDVRAGRDEVRDAAAPRILEAIAAIAAARAVGLEVREVQALAASPCDPALTDRLAEAVAATGQPPRRLVSGAGHDAMVMAALAPTAMLFIRCADGISHNPLEDVIVQDVERALEAMLRFIEGLAA